MDSFLGLRARRGVFVRSTTLSTVSRDERAATLGLPRAWAESAFRTSD